MDHLKHRRWVNGLARFSASFLALTLFLPPHGIAAHQPLPPEHARPHSCSARHGTPSSGPNPAGKQTSPSWNRRTSDLAIRSGNAKTVYILTNYNAAPQTITLPHAMTDVLTGNSSTSITLPQYGIAVLR